MRLVTRLSLAFLLVVLPVISLHEWRQYHREVTDFEDDMDRGHALVASGLADALGWVLAREGQDAAARLLTALGDAQDRDIRVRWVCRPGLAPTGDLPLSCRELGELRSPRLLLQPTTDGPARRFAFAAVRGPRGAEGAVEVSEAPEHEGAWARRHIREALGLMATTVLATTVLSFVLGWWLVARPTRRLMEKARAIGEGVLDSPLAVRTRDELGELAHEMNAMAAQLSAARRAADEAAVARGRATEQLRHADRLATVGRLASGMAHELGTPLNVVEVRAGLILESDAADEAIRDSAQAIRESTERMERLVRQLLAFARQRELERAPVALDALVRAVAEWIRPVAARRAVQVQAAEIDPVTARGDAVLLQQALTNIVMNAVQACSEGGHVGLALRRDRAARPGTDALMDVAVLTVRDDGTGMSDPVREKVFEPFFTTKEPGEGTGLGLAVAWGIVEDHEGWISVESAPAKGSVFSLFLPEVNA
jgi:two-component system NtrC family sensor kinase